MWTGKRVLLTGHTGFKGAWLALWLAQLGAEVHGFSGPPPSDPSLYEQAAVRDVLAGEYLGDVRNENAIAHAVQSVAPDVVFHLAAQAIVRRSLVDPVGTWETNVIGTVNLLHACSDVRAVVVVTSDKCYRDIETGRAMTEDDPLGGKDPYSASKAAQELVTRSHRETILRDRGVQVATARAGNVIGGGDWAADRLIPDLVRAAAAGRSLVLRNPDAVRPWQHVLNPLSGYLRLAERMLEHEGYDGAWNFGPAAEDARSVGEVARAWPDGPNIEIEPDPDGVKESKLLRLDSAKAHARLGWTPLCDLDMGLRMTADWHGSPQPPRERTLTQIADIAR